ncbi:hypothetical protein SEA_FREGLEY_87 [Microbacterium phage Fregley]|nr:hypothetical protein SEA_FREGLEY_87 [Microbacterium phage Fregley]
MHVLIDDQKVVDVTALTMKDENTGETMTLAFEDAHRILDTWKELRPGHRGFRYGGDDSDDEPSVIIVAEALAHGLVLDDIDPHWDGVSTRNAYRYVDLSAVLPLRVVE